MPTTNKQSYPESMWAGSEHSLMSAIQAEDRSIQAMSAGLLSGKTMEDDEEDPYLLSVQGNVGVVSIRGPLVNRDSPYNRYFGVTSYADIRRALIAAAEKPEVEGILLDIDSGGGAVNGVADTADLIRSVDRGVKPVWAFTEGTMASAAYWLGSSARQVFASRTSITGSIGVIATHMEYSKALKEAGIGVTVVRAGEYKALANSVEPLSEVAQRQLQDQLNSAYQVFIGHVAESRGVTVNLADQKMGQGREFFGEQALTAGLVDGIDNFDSVMGRFSNKLLDTTAVTQNNNGKYQRGLDMTRKALTQQQIAALASGAPVEAEATPPAAEASTETPAAEAAPATETSAEAATPAPEQPATPAPAAAQDSVVTFLQSQLAAAQEQILNLRLELKGAQDQVTAMRASHDGLKAIAAQSLKNMKVALGLPGVSADLSAEALLADHASTSESFNKAFKAGGVAATAAPEAPKPAALTDPLWSAKLAAARLSN